MKYLPLFAGFVARHCINYMHCAGWCDDYAFGKRVFVINVLAILIEEFPFLHSSDQEYFSNTRPPPSRSLHKFIIFKFLSTLNKLYSWNVAIIRHALGISQRHAMVPHRRHDYEWLVQEGRGKKLPSSVLRWVLVFARTVSWQHTLGW